MSELTFDPNKAEVIALAEYRAQLGRKTSDPSDKYMHFSNAADYFYKGGDLERSIIYRLRQARYSYNEREASHAYYYGALACEKLEKWDSAAKLHFKSVEMASVWIELIKSSINFRKESLYKAQKNRINMLGRIGYCLAKTGQIKGARKFFETALDLAATEPNQQDRIPNILKSMTEFGITPSRDYGQPRP